MRTSGRWRTSVALAAAFAMMATACGGDDGGTADPTETGTDGSPSASVEFDTGVTEEPCPDAVNEDNGCIYLGILSDLTEGPFAPLGVEIVKGQEAFWRTVNEAGGIGGFDIDVTTYTRDNKYNQQEHVARYREIEPEILALAQSLGTPPTLAALDAYEEDGVVAAPASWWSGWSVSDTDKGLILESGYPYCIESMNGLDWYVEENGAIESVLSVGYPGDYGGDGAAGAEAWAEANDVEFAGFTQTGPNAVTGNQDAAVQAILGASPDVVQISTGPAEMAEIVGKSVAQGFEGQFIGSVPTWNPALLQSDAAPAIQAAYVYVAPWGPFGSDTPAHDAMAAALGEGELPGNDGYTFGWIWSYPLKAALEAAADGGDLTREGLLSVVQELEVDYEGALPTRQLGGSPNDTVVRTSNIVVPDPEAPLGASVSVPDYTGPTAEAYQFDAPCATAG